MNQTFKGLKVVELASVLAGPSVGMFFAELGATVIKIENKKTGGDLTRKWKLPNEPKDRNYSAYYCSINWGKKEIFLNLKDSQDYEHLISILSDADIVISNFRKKQSEGLKVDFETLSKINTKLIYAQLTGFGEEDPRPAFDVVLQAEAGFLYMCGEPDRPPSKMPVALIDVLAAHQLKEGILIALLQREKTGKGSLVTSSLYKSALASLVNQASNWLMAGHIPQPMGTLHPNIAPYGESFRTSDDKLIVLAVGTDVQFENLCLSLGLKMHEDERFSTNTNRVIHRELLGRYLQETIQEISYALLEKRFAERQVPYGRVRNMKEVFEQPGAEQMILEDIRPDGGVGRRVKTIGFDIDSL